MSEKQLQQVNPLLASLAVTLASVVKILVGYMVTAFPRWNEGVVRLSQLMEQKGVEEPSLDLLFDVIEETPETSISEANNAFMTLPLLIRLSVNGAVGITQGILKGKPKWTQELAVQREKMILMCLRNPGDPSYVKLAQVLEEHPRTLKIVTMWIWSKVGIPYIERPEGDQLPTPEGAN